jgi:septation ring formation regulator EzrA
MQSELREQSEDERVYNMKRKFLEDLGLDKETIDKILDEHSSEIGKTKGNSESLKTEVETLKNDLKTRDEQLETLKKSTGDVSELQKQIESLQKENTSAKETHEKAMKQIQLDSVVEKALTGAKAKNSKAVRALLNLDDAEFDGESVKGLEDQLKALQDGEDSKFLFESKVPEKTVFKGLNPQGQPGTPNAQQAPNSLNDAIRAHLENK